MTTGYNTQHNQNIQNVREKAVNLNEAIDMLRSSEVAAQHIKEIDQGTSEEVVHFNKREKTNRSPGKSLYL